MVQGLEYGVRMQWIQSFLYLTCYASLRKFLLFWKNLVFAFVFRNNVVGILTL